MRIRRKILWLTSVFCLGLAACNETARKPVQVRPDVPLPAPANTKEILPLQVTAPPRFYIGGQRRPAIDVFVDQVQAIYDQAQKDYQAGNLDAAREAFDHAVDLILTSKLGKDPRVKDLFNRIADTIHNYELDAAPKEASVTDAEDEGQPAPIEEIADLTLPAGDPRLAKIAEQELISVPHDLPLTVNEAVLSYLSYFQTRRGRAIVETGLRRAGLYRDMIRKVLKEEGLPQDLIYLAQAESAFQPVATSRAGARGVWQFMPFRGQEYGLNHDKWVDERADPEKATRAAAHHLRDLYKIFGDWYLVMAAYNSGPLNVAKAVQRTGYADFWELEKRNALPNQTRNYVPIILALTMIAKDPARYGVRVRPDSPVPVDLVKPGHSLGLDLAADSIDSSVETLRALNPELLHLQTPEDSDFQLRLPYGTAERFRIEMAKVPVDKWLSWRRHRMVEGETLTAVARRYHVTLAALTAANGIKSGDDPPSGAKLIVPAAPVPMAQVVRYRVVKGDTLESIAQQFGVTAAELRRWNHLRGNLPPHGARLRVAQGAELRPAVSRSARRKHRRKSLHSQSTGHSKASNTGQ